MTDDFAAFLKTFDDARPIEWHDTALFARLLPKPAVYAIYRHGRLLYIGSTKNLASRIGRRHHILNLIPPGNITVKARYCDDYRERETKLIQRVHPPLNTRTCA